MSEPFLITQDQKYVSFQSCPVTNMVDQHLPIGPDPGIIEKHLLHKDSDPSGQFHLLASIPLSLFHEDLHWDFVSASLLLQLPLVRKPKTPIVGQ